MCHHSSKVFEVIRTISSLFIYLFFFLRKDFKRTKTRHKQKPTNKTKLSKQKATKATFFRTHKNSKRGKLFVLRFGAFLLLKCIPIDQPMENYFSTNRTNYFLSHLPIFYLCALIPIFSFVCTRFDQ